MQPITLQYKYKVCVSIIDDYFTTVYDNKSSEKLGAEKLCCFFTPSSLKTNYLNEVFFAI